LIEDFFFTIKPYFMPNKRSLLPISLFLLLFGCMKSSNTSNSPLLPSISQAQDFFNKEVSGSGILPNAKNYRASRSRSVDWNKAIIKHLSSGEVLVAPVIYKDKLIVSSNDAPYLAYDLNTLTSLVITRYSLKEMHAYMITFLPDITSNVDSLAGTYFVEDWQGNSIYKPVRHKAIAASSGGDNSRPSNSKEIDIVQTIQICAEIVGYNYSPDFPDAGFAWTETTCTSFSINTGQPTAALPSGDLPSLHPTTMSQFGPLVVVVAPPGNPIANITDYLKCFTDGTLPDHTYTIQVCVDQPNPGTRQAWGFTPGGVSGSSAAGNFVNVGHVFLIFSENDQGHVTTRNLGLYPSSLVIPPSNFSSSQGVLNNDQSHPLNISLTIEVSSSQFFSILNYSMLGNNQGYNYDLNNNNCTTFALNALAAGGITLPSTKGTWPGGSGNDPGDLGEDIRKMSLTPNMTRNTAENDHPNVGNCN
jgi:hypothetical protein